MHRDMNKCDRATTSILRVFSISAHFGRSLPRLRFTPGHSEANVPIVSKTRCRLLPIRSFKSVCKADRSEILCVFLFTAKDRVGRLTPPLQHDISPKTRNVNSVRMRYHHLVQENAQFKGKAVSVSVQAIIRRCPPDVLDLASHCPPTNLFPNLRTSPIVPRR
jgi:hypothetical protein